MATVHPDWPNLRRRLPIDRREAAANGPQYTHDISVARASPLPFPRPAHASLALHLPSPVTPSQMLPFSVSSPDLASTNPVAERGSTSSGPRSLKQQPEQRCEVQRGQRHTALTGSVSAGPGRPTGADTTRPRQRRLGTSIRPRGYRLLNLAHPFASSASASERPRKGGQWT